MSRAIRRFTRTNAPLATLTTPAFRVTVFYLVDNQVALFNMDYIMQTSTISAAAESNIGSTFLTAALAGLRAMLSADCLLTQVKVTCLTIITRQPVVTAVAAASQAGTGGAGHLDSQVSAQYTKQTAVKGQHGRGRCYLPGVPLGFCTQTTDANRLNASGIAQMGTTANALLSNTIADGTNVAIAAVTTRVVKGQPTTAGAPLTFLIARALLSIIRRRRIGRGK
jgi:hypothetical protein